MPLPAGLADAAATLGLDRLRRDEFTGEVRAHNKATDDALRIPTADHSHGFNGNSGLRHFRQHSFGDPRDRHAAGVQISPRSAGRR